MQLKRITTLAIAITALAAPGASARLPVDGPVGKQSPQPAISGHSAQSQSSTSGHADIAARRDAIANRHWEQARNVPVSALTRPQDGGFDWPSAVIGGAVPVALLLLGLLARPMVTRRRSAIA